MNDEEMFEDQVEHIDELSSPELSLSAPKESKPKMTTKETRAAIAKAVKNGDIPASQGRTLLAQLGMIPISTSNKKIISTATRKNKRKAQKIARKRNR